MMAVQKQNPYCIIAIFLTPCFIIGFSIFLYALLDKPGRITWKADQAWKWYRDQKWLVGPNYINRDAVNTLEMWGDEFNATQINEELGWAEMKLKMNAIRVFLHYSMYQKNSTEFLGKVDQLLTIADQHKIKTILVLFDDVWNPKFNASGKQPDPTPHVHNSQWVQCPGEELLFDSGKWVSILQPYTTGVINRFKSDQRVLMWDLYNEPGNFNANRKYIVLSKVDFLQQTRAKFTNARTVYASAS